MYFDLKTYRKKAGLTQAELAEKLAVTSRTVSSWECGAVQPSVSQLWNCAEILNCTPNDLCCWYELHPEQKTKGVVLLNNYREATDKTRRVVDELLDLEN